MVDKVKKVELRDVVRVELAQMILKSRGMATIGRTKEGLLLREEFEGKRVDVIVRVIQKKALVETAEIVEHIKLDVEVEKVDEIEDVVEVGEVAEQWK